MGKSMIVGEIKIDAIQFDASTQCRAEIRMDVVEEYAEMQAAGDRFPPVVLFGSEDKCWIGDGWHRLYAAKENKMEIINAELNGGTRTDAVKCALRANITNGARRSNADKRRSVDVALREFKKQKLSSRIIAEMCGVSHPFVNNIRPEEDVETVSTPTRTDTQGRQQPAHKPKKTKDVEPEEQEENGETEPKTVANKPEEPRNNKPSYGLTYADEAISALSKIARDDTQRKEARKMVLDWVKKHL